MPMMVTQQQFIVHTPGRGLLKITDQVKAIVAQATIHTGLCHIFLHHTSASLILGENADPTVLRDLEAFMTRLIPDGDALYEHTDEGPDDMPSHVRSVLTANSIQVPISAGILALGTWQGIYLWEHRIKSHERKVTVSIVGN